MKKYIKKQGISILILILAIIIVIITILSTAVVSNITRNNIPETANESVLKQNFKMLQDELTMYVAQQNAKTHGDFDVSYLSADANSVTYTGIGKIEEKNIYEILISLEKIEKYSEYVTIVNGKITLSELMPEKQREWTNEILSNWTEEDL